MAKRYKENEKKRGKFKLKNILLLIILIVTITILIIGIKQDWFKFNYIEEKIKAQQAEEISAEIFQNITQKVEENRKLTSNLLKPAELNNEIDSIINEEEENKDNNYIVKIQYKLKELNSGTIEVYYKVKENNLIKMTINIETKEIETTEQYEDEFLFSKNRIEENLDENIEEDFNKNKEKIVPETTFLNIIITNTEVVTNIGYL